MKQLKFLMVALTLLMGISLTSCLNSDNNYDKTRQGFARVKSSMGLSWFEDAGGNKLYPTPASLAKVQADQGFSMSSTNLALIQFTPVETEAASKTNTQESTSLDINLTGAMNCDGPQPIVVQNALEMESAATESAPIILLNTGGYSYYPSYLFDKEIIMLTIFFRQTNSADKTKEHKFKLIANLEDITAESTDLILYLRHDKGTDDGKEASNFVYSGYDIREAVSEFTGITGKEPQKIKIKVKETGEYSSSDNTLPKDYKEYSCEYKIGSILSTTN